MAIGERLKEERSRLGLSQTDFGALASVGKTTQINYEKGNGSPDAKYLAAVAEQGVDVLYVVTGSRVPTATNALTPDEDTLLANYRQLDEKARTTLQDVAQAMARVATLAQ